MARIFDYEVNRKRKYEVKLRKKNWWICEMSNANRLGKLHFLKWIVVTKSILYPQVATIVWGFITFMYQKNTEGQFFWANYFIGCFKLLRSSNIRGALKLGLLSRVPPPPPSAKTCGDFGILSFLITETKVGKWINNTIWWSMYVRIMGNSRWKMRWKMNFVFLIVVISKYVNFICKV